LGTAAVAATGDFDAAGTAAGLVDDLSGVSNQATARANLGLGTAATAATGDFAAASHTHTGTQVAVDASGFNGNLTTSDDTVQEIAQKLDALSIPAAGVSGTPVVAASKVVATGAYGSPLYPPVATGGTVTVGLGDMVAIAASGAPATLAKVGYEVTATSATAGQVCKLGCYAVNTDGSIGTLTWSEDLPADAVAGVMRTLSTTRAVPELRAWVILNPFANAGSVTFRAWAPVPSHVGITSVYHNRFGFGLSASITALPSDLSGYKFNYTDSASPSYWGHNNISTMPCLVGVT
jgi:hypothetical protein